MSNNGPSEIISKTGQGRPEGGSLRVLRAASIIVVAVGAIGSLVFMFRAGRRTPRFLLILFTIWVLSPFVALLWANTVSKRWSVLTRATLYCVTIIVTLGSLAIYSEWVNLRPAGSANAFLFVAIPPASLLFIGIVVPMAALLSRRLSRRGAGS